MNHAKKNRREFLTGVGSAGAAAFLAASAPGAATICAAGGTQELAIRGGTPIRKELLRSQPYGPQFYDDIEKQELLEVLEARAPNRWNAKESKTLEFEKAFAGHIGVKYALGVTSGTTALVTAMAAMEIGPGDEVILPAWTWYADYDAIVLAGALPVFAEIDDSFNIDPADIEAKITPRTKAIIAVHLQGTTADMDPILLLAEKHNLMVLEDCAQCLGGKYKGKYVGSIGDIAINSFQLSKSITAGEGGAVVTNDSELFERAVRFHDVSSLRPPYKNDFGGGLLAGFAACNFRMNEFTGAVLKGQLTKLETICSGLRNNARKVRHGIADLPGLKLRKSFDLAGDLGVGVFLEMDNRKERDDFLRAMRAEGVYAAGPSGSVVLPVDERIESKRTIHVDWPSFSSPQGKAIRYGSQCCPRTIDIIDRYTGVIMDPTFGDEEVNDIVRAIRKVYTAMNFA